MSRNDRLWDAVLKQSKSKKVAKHKYHHDDTKLPARTPKIHFHHKAKYLWSMNKFLPDIQ
jgi:hypothetical protein